MEFIATFGQWIRSRRKSLGLTQDQLARQVGCSLAAIKKIESDDRRPSRQAASLLAEQLQLLPEQRDVFIQVARGELPLGRLPASVVDTPPPPPAALMLPQVDSAPPIPVPPAASHARIPHPATLLIGRERELETITHLLQDPLCRLLTLTGMGGTGKTRLAMEAALQLQATFSDGACFVSLAGVASPGFIVPAIANALEMPFSGPGDIKQQLFQSLRGKQILIVLDNLDHLLGGVELVGELLLAAPGVKVLATSREQLHLQAEWVIEVRGLPVPHNSLVSAIESGSAVSLFIQRMRQVRSEVVLDAADIAMIGRICQLVQGLPLAIELAARWTRTLSFAEIAQEIEQGLALLSTDRRGVGHSDPAARHRSLGAVFDHSWALLAPHEQMVLKRLSVFRDGFQREAASQVAQAGLPVLSALIDKSLMMRGEADRFQIHELVRQYLAARLCEDELEERSTRALHSRYYLTLLQTSEAALRSTRQKDVLGGLDADMDNIRLAWNTAVEENEVDLLYQSAGPLYYYYELHQNFKEAEALFRQAAERVRLCLSAGEGQWTPQEQARLNLILASLLNYQAFFNQRLGNNQDAGLLYDASLELLRPLHLSGSDCFPLAFALVHRGVVFWAMGDFPQAALYLEESQTLTAALDETWLHSFALGFLGGVAHDRGDYLRAHDLLREAVRRCQVDGDPEIVMLMVIYFSRTLLALNQYDQARPLLEEGLAHVQATGNRWLTALGLEYLARIARAAGKDTDAHSLLAESIHLHREVGDQWSLSLGLIELSRLKQQTSAYAAAEQHALEALKIGIETGFSPIVLDSLSLLASICFQQGLAVEALSLLNPILEHPAARQDTRDQATALREKISAALLAAATQTAGEVDLNVLMRERFGICFSAQF